MRTPVHDPLLERATLKERGRIFLSRCSGFEGALTRLVVRAEIADRINSDTADPEISPRALADFFLTMLHTPPDKAYGLLAQPVPAVDAKEHSGRVWFDAIEGLTNHSIVQSVAAQARRLAPPDKSRWEHAADLGAGTGELGKLLLDDGSGGRIADQVTLVDRTPELLGVAARRYGDAMNYVRGDVLQLPFADESFDLMTSGGLVHSLGSAVQNAYFGEVSRLLKPGGVYLDGDQHEGPRVTRNPGRSRLSRLIMWEASGLEIMGDPLHGVDKESYFSEFGLAFSEQILEHPGVEPITLRILQKPTELWV